jgi:hypothetical protein
MCSVFHVSLFRELGRAPRVIRRFEGTERLQDTVREVQRRLHAT